MDLEQIKAIAKQKRRVAPAETRPEDAKRARNDVPETSGNSRVLPEDEYIDKLESIIQRDFYPELPQLRAQVEYLEAMETGDAHRMQHILVDHQQQRSAEDEDASRLSLDAFQARYTSEDTHSFGQLLRSDQLKQQQRFDRLYVNNPKNLLLQGASSSTDNIKSIEDRKRILALTDGSELRPNGIYHMDTNPPRNALMFGAEGRGSALDTEALQLKPKQILIHNTRLPETNDQDKTHEPATTQNRARKGGDYGMGEYEYVEMTPLVEHAVETVKSKFTPQLLDAPSSTTKADHLDPSSIGLDFSRRSTTAGDSSRPSFKLPSASLRDELAKKLGDRATKSLSLKGRNQSQTELGGRTPLISDMTRAPTAGTTSGASATSTRVGTVRRLERGLSPAAQQLLARTKARTKGNETPRFFPSDSSNRK